MLTEVVRQDCSSTKKKTTNSSQGIEVSVKNVCIGPKVRSVKRAKIAERGATSDEMEIEIVVGVEAQRERERGVGG